MLFPLINLLQPAEKYSFTLMNQTIWLNQYLHVLQPAVLKAPQSTMQLPSFTAVLFGLSLVINLYSLILNSIVIYS